MVPLAVIDSTVFARPLNGDRNLLNFKAMLARRFLTPEEKVGLVSSRSSAGRAAQGLASFAIPGDMSDIRSPVRSTVYEVITPGGGGGRNRRNLLGARIGGSRGSAASGLRCPAGFEFGGRFATRGFGNCGRRLFDAPGGGRSGAGGTSATALVGLLRREGRRIGGGNYDGRAVQIQRNAEIPRVAAANEEKFNQGVSRSVAALGNPDVDGVLLVRRDGQVLRSAVSANVLSGVSKNPDMQDGALISAVTTPATMGNDEVPTLWKSGVRKVALALPGGGSISVARSGDLNEAGKRRLARAWAKSSNDSDGEYDYGLRLRRLVEESDGLLTYEETFPNIDKPDDTVTIAEIGNEDNLLTVQRWVLKTYLEKNAPGRADDAKRSWKEVDVVSTNASVESEGIPDLAAAVAHLKANKDPYEVPAPLLEDAISRSKVFRSRKVRDGVTILERADGKQWYRISSDDQSYRHIAERVSADVQGALGLEPPPVKFLGDGAKRDVLVAHPNNTGRQARRSGVASLDYRDLFRMVVADWLTDNRDRSPGSLLSIGTGDRSRVIPTSNGRSALAGLSTDELERRRALTLGDFAGQSLNARAAERFRNLASAQRKILLELYTEMLERASNFNWDDYTSRLGLDGELSPGEKAHLELVKRLFERRLKQLQSGRKRFLSTMGIE